MAAGYRRRTVEVRGKGKIDRLLPTGESAFRLLLPPSPAQFHHSLCSVFSFVNRLAVLLGFYRRNRVRQLLHVELGRYGRVPVPHSSFHESPGIIKYQPTSDIHLLRPSHQYPVLIISGMSLLLIVDEPVLKARNPSSVDFFVPSTCPVPRMTQVQSNETALSKNGSNEQWSDTWIDRSQHAS